MGLGEADTRAKLIDPAIHARGWTENLIRREEARSSYISPDFVESLGGFEAFTGSVAKILEGFDAAFLHQTNRANLQGWLREIHHEFSGILPGLN